MQISGARYGTLEYILRQELYKRSAANRAIIIVTTVCLILATVVMMIVAAVHLHREKTSQVERNGIGVRLGRLQVLGHEPVYRCCIGTPQTPLLFFVVELVSMCLACSILSTEVRSNEEPD